MAVPKWVAVTGLAQHLLSEVNTAPPGGPIVLGRVW